MKEARHCIACGTGLSPRIVEGKQRLVCTTCGWIYYPQLKVGAAVLIEEERRVLLLRRAREPFKGEWSLPSGYVDADEDPRDAAVRETREETGLHVAARDAFDTFFFDDDPRGNGVLVVYRAGIIENTPQLGDENDAMDWFGRGDLPSKIAGGGHDLAIAMWRNDE